MYTKEKFGIELKNKIRAKYPIEAIGIWAHTIYLEHIMDIDLEFRETLLTLNTMELGPEFAMSYEELNEIADNLIAEKKL